MNTTNKQNGKDSNSKFELLNATKHAFWNNRRQHSYLTQLRFR